MVKTCVAAAFALLLLACAAGAGEEAAAVPLFGRFEQAVTTQALGIEGEHDPFDPDDVKVDAVVTHPDGSKRAYPCFWYVPHEQYFARAAREDGKGDVQWEMFRPKGKSGWRLRLCPLKTGSYEYRYQVTAGGKTWEKPGGSFRVTQPEKADAGPVRMKKGSRYFRRYDGSPFVPIGENLGWPEEDGSRGYAKWLKALSAAGGNCGRLWLVHYMGGTSLEWTGADTNLDYGGVGHYSQESAARVDRILEAARENGVYLILSFFSFGDTNWDWRHNPYNKAAGGWLEQPAQFFTDERARKATRNQLRYAVARYGWSPNVWAWELWNEVETSAGFEGRAVAEWHREMAAYLKSVDGHEHLVTTSYRFTPPYTDCAAYGLDEIDFVQVHSYMPQIMSTFPQRVREVWQFNKPVAIAEYGLNVSPDYFDADPAGLHLHDGLWAGVFSGSAGTAMTWWWERYVHPRDLYFHYTGISRFLQGESLEGAVTCPSRVDEGKNEHFSLALKSGNKLLAWVGHNRNVTTSYVSDQLRVQAYKCDFPSQPVTLRVSGDFAGPQWVVFYDTFDGVAVRVTRATGTRDGIAIRVPGFRHDVALKCTPEADGYPAPTITGKMPIHERFIKLSAKPPGGNAQ